MSKSIKTILFFPVIICVSCDGTCDEGHTEEVLDNGTVICTPDYIYGPMHDFELGDRYYHKSYGFITKKGDVWTNSFNEVISPE